MSRSHVVYFDALTEHLLAGRFKAGLDVYPEEPLPADHPIRKAPGVVFSTHRAGAIGEALRNIGTLVADDVEALSAGLVPRAMPAADPDFVRMRAGPSLSLPTSSSLVSREPSPAPRFGPTAANRIDG